MGKLIDKDKIVAYIESQIDSLERNSGCSGIFGETQMAVYDKLYSFLDTLEVKDAIDALRTEYEKGRADVIAKACQFLNDYQEYPDHDISPTQLMEAFRLFMQIKD